MLISKDNDGKVIGWHETYFSKNESVDVSVVGNISTITTRSALPMSVSGKTGGGRCAANSSMFS